jgi:hypothetical protein
MHVYPAPYLMIYFFLTFLVSVIDVVNFKYISNKVIYLVSHVVSFNFPAVFAISITPIYII